MCRMETLEIEMKTLENSGSNYILKKTALLIQRNMFLSLA